MAKKTRRLANADRQDDDWSQQLLALIQYRYRQLNALSKSDRAQYLALEAEIRGLSEQYTALHVSAPISRASAPPPRTCADDHRTS